MGRRGLRRPADPAQAALVDIATGYPATLAIIKISAAANAQITSRKLDTRPKTRASVEGLSWRWIILIFALSFYYSYLVPNLFRYHHAYNKVNNISTGVINCSVVNEYNLTTIFSYSRVTRLIMIQTANNFDLLDLHCHMYQLTGDSKEKYAIGHGAYRRFTEKNRIMIQEVYLDILYEDIQMYCDLAYDIGKELKYRYLEQLSSE